MATGLALWIAAGCAATAHAGEVVLLDPGSGGALRIESLREARFRRTVAQQSDYSCGAAAVATLLTFHYGQPTRERDAFLAMWKTGDREQIQRRGFSLLDMRRYLAGRGLVAEGYRLALDDLARLGLPAIALLDLGSYKHFVVIEGISGHEVLVSDPARGAQALPRRGFELMQDDVVLLVRSRTPVRGGQLATGWKLQLPAPTALGVPRAGIGGAVQWLPRGNEF